MKIIKNIASPEVTNAVNEGKIIVAKTDTIYGLLARADSHKAVAKVYQLKGRSYDKPCILLTNSYLNIPNLNPTQLTKYRELNKQRPTTIITTKTNEPQWITRGGSTVAWRAVSKPSLARLISSTGPLIAPSANKQGDVPAQTTEQATDYFGDLVDLYVDEGECKEGGESRIVQISEDGKVTFLR